MADGTTALILAAGFSRRMGHPKALLSLGERTALEQILATLHGCGVTDCRVVLGVDAPQIREETRLEGVDVRVNPAPTRGRTSSIQTGVADWPPDRACLLWPVDQPFVAAQTVEAVLGADASDAIVIPSFERRRGHPIRIPADRLSEIGDLEPDEPLRNWVRRQTIHHVEVADPFCVRDANTPKEFEALLREWNANG